MFKLSVILCGVIFNGGCIQADKNTELYPTKAACLVEGRKLVEFVARRSQPWGIHYAIYCKLQAGA